MQILVNWLSPKDIYHLMRRYDFAVFGFMAVEIGKNFFGSASETTQLIATFAVFGMIISP